MDSVARPEVQDGIWVHGPSLNRGRAAKDPQAQTTTYTVSSLDEFQASLRAYLDNPPAAPEHSECRLSFWIGASFLVTLGTSAVPSPQHHQQPQTPSLPQPHHPHQHPQLPPSQPPTPISQPYPPSAGLDVHYTVAAGAISAANAATTPAPTPAPTLQQQQQQQPPPPPPSTPVSAPPQHYLQQHQPQKQDTQAIRTSLSILEALAPTPDPKDRMRKQRAIAKTCVDAIQAVDGFRYSFHNNWNSREDDAFRFSYYCNDSLLNKDRAANGKAAKFGKRACKPVYDCRGVLSVKFSAIKSSLDVFYKHVPLHKTYEERAPPPRRDSKRRKWLEQNNPAAIPTPKRQLTADPESMDPKKRKRRDSQKTSGGTSIEADLRAQSLQSLLDLIRTDPPVSTASSFEVQESRSMMDPAQSRRRPKTSCDLCRLKRIKCDAGHPKCKACAEKNRDCQYTDRSVDAIRDALPAGQYNPRTPSDNTAIQLDTISTSTNMALSDLDQGLTTPLSDTIRSTVTTELDKLRAELAEAKQRIGQLEAEKQKTDATQQPTPTSAVQPHHDTLPQQYSSVQPQATHLGHATNALQHANSLQSPTSLQHTPSLQPPFDRHTWPYYGYQPAPMHPPRADQWSPQRNPTLYR